MPPFAPKLLVIDDDEASCRLVVAIFATEGMSVSTAHDGQSGVDAVLANAPDLVLLDIDLPDTDGIEVLEILGQKAPGLPVVMLTAHREVKTAVRATRLGAWDYLTKPIDQDEVVAVVRRALEARALKREVETLRREVAEAGLASQMGPSDQVKDVAEQVTTVAGSRFTVLIVGETGTGKELVAHAIHRKSDRRTGPFIALDCGAIPEPLLESELFGHEKGSFTGADRKKQGRFQLAEGGTLFLDEVGNLPSTLQPKLLRVLESQQVTAVGGARATAMNVRFVAATNDDLQARVSDGRFRADLYFRLAQYTVNLPPLRERKADIPFLAAKFVSEASIELRRPVLEIQADALEILERHSWPGNVRELRNVVRQAVLKTKDLVVRKETVRVILGSGKTRGGVSNSQVPPAASLKDLATQAAQSAERDAICATLRATGGNKAQTARVLKTDYKTLYLKMKSLGIRAKDYAP